MQLPTGGCPMVSPTTPSATIEEVEVLGMPLERWTLESCEADFATGNDWATLYSIESHERGKGHATELLRQAKSYYEEQGKRVGGTVALNPAMRSIYHKLGYHEYA